MKAKLSKPSKLPKVPANSPTRAPERLDFFVGVRGWLACWVMFGHLFRFLSWYGQGKAWWWFDHIRSGKIPVPEFMILSGYVIFGLLERRHETPTVFITRRFLRLFPAFLFAFVVGVLVTAMQHNILQALPWGGDPWVKHQADLADVHLLNAGKNILAHLGMLHGFVPQTWWPDATGAFLGVGWSIATEWQFYLLAPFLWKVAQNQIGRVAVLSLVVLVYQVQHTTGLFADFDNESKSLITFHIQLFLLGAISFYVCRYIMSRLSEDRSFRPWVIMAMIGLSFTWLTDPVLRIWLFLCWGLITLETCRKTWEARVMHAGFCNPLVMALGEASYSIYLIHWPLTIWLLQFFHLLPSGLSEVVRKGVFTAVVSVVTVLIARQMYRRIELPAIQWGKVRFRR